MDSHPKLEIALKIILEHFQKHADNKTQTRIMVFSSVRLA